MGLASPRQGRQGQDQGVRPRTRAGARARGEKGEELWAADYGIGGWQQRRRLGGSSRRAGREEGSPAAPGSRKREKALSPGMMGFRPANADALMLSGSGRVTSVISPTKLSPVFVRPSRSRSVGSPPSGRPWGRRRGSGSCGGSRWRAEVGLGFLGVDRRWWWGRGRRCGGRRMRDEHSYLVRMRGRTGLGAC